MGCNSDYLNASGDEVAISRVACLLDELAGQSRINANHWAGFHPAVYNICTSEHADALVSRLCEALQNEDVSKRSLEMQIWWRDHQAADKARVQAEMQAATTSAEVDAALAKLTPHERALLGY